MNLPDQDYDARRIVADAVTQPVAAPDNVRNPQPVMTKLLKISTREMADMFGLDDSASRRSILVVDDEPDMRHLMSEVLANSGYMVEVADSGTRAWKALHLKRFDLIVTDQEMPGMTGTQLVSKLRLAGFQMPVILASGSPPLDLAGRTSCAAQVTLLPKPFTLGELIKLVKELAPEVNAAVAAQGEDSFAETWPESFRRF